MDIQHYFVELLRIFILKGEKDLLFVSSRGLQPAWSDGEIPSLVTPASGGRLQIAVKQERLGPR